MSAAADADHMGRFVDDMVDHLQSIGCTSKREVNKFFRMARQTLASLYSAASKPQPSPSELMRPALRFALDPRKPIEGDVGRFHLEQVNNGWRVVEYPSVARKVPAIPLPGRLIRSLYAVRIFDHLHHDPPQLYRLMGLIETILGCIPTEKDCLHEKPRAAKPPNVPKIKVDLEESKDIVWLNGKPVSVGLAQTYFLDAVVGAKGDWISSTEIIASKKHRAAVGARPDRVFRSLPRKISSLLEAKKAKGFRLRVT